MTDLANHLQAELNYGLSPTDASLWAKLVPLIEAKGLEAALLELAPTTTLEALIISKTVEMIGRSESAIISEVFAKTRTLRLTKLLPHLLKPSGGLPIVTTNYDRLVEIAAEEAGLGVDTMFVGSFAGELNDRESRLSFCRDVTLRGKQVHWEYRPRVNVFKPHGSLDWYHREGKPVRFSGELSAPRLIITPGLNKFRNGYESPFDRHRERANSAIDRAGRFLILGYGFNDDHLETHLTPRIRDGIPTLLLTYALSPNAKKLVDTCPNVIAIQKASLAVGTSVFVNQVETFVPDLALWELSTFVSEVFEP